jgi:hypothetical protein
MSCLSGNEIYSLEDIANEYFLEKDDPVLYTLYLSRNPELDQDEVDNIKAYIAKLVKKNRRINQLNMEYMDRHKVKEGMK